VDEGGLPAGVALVGTKLGQAGRRVGVYLGEVAVDRQLGIRTAGIVRNEQALHGFAQHADGQYYQPISRSGFRQVIAAAGVNPRTAAFIDLGAGRGRALIFAAEEGFKDVRGVELDATLASEARANVTSWAKRRRRAGEGPDITVDVGDAVEVELPPGPVLVFVYNSFGESTLRVVLARLIASADANPRPITLCYFNPVHARVIDDEERLIVTARSPYWLVCTVR
jgi:hypothetical protein